MIGPVAYELALLSCIRVHNVFHVSLLKKYIPDFNHVINWNVISVIRVILFSLLIYIYIYMYVCMYEHGTKHVIECIIYICNKSTLITWITSQSIIWLASSI